MRSAPAKQTARLAAVLLALSVLIGIAARAEAPAYAANGDPAIASGSGVLARNAGQDSCQRVFYGDQFWYVIAFDGKNGSGETLRYTDPAGAEQQLYPESAVTLLPVGVGWHSAFNSSQSGAYVNAYGWTDSDAAEPQTPSDLRSFIESRYLTGYEDNGEPVAAALDGREQAAILPRVLAGVMDGEPYDSNKIRGAAIENALLWPLSEAEAGCLPDSIRYVWQGIYWWLRSPGDANSLGTSVLDDCTILRNFHFVHTVLGVRPAFFLDRNAVLFTSAAKNGKVSGALGADALKPAGTNTTDDWKVTIKDAAHADFAVTSVSRPAGSKVVTIGYSGAAEEENGTISAVIKNASGAVRYYGRVAAANASSGTAKINLANRMKNGDRLYVFNEQYNGDDRTDYASPLARVAITRSANPLRVKGRSFAVRYRRLKKKAQKRKRARVIRFVKTGKGTKTYRLVSAKKGKKSFRKRFRINKKTGLLTIRKGLRKGLYRVTVKVRAAGGIFYKRSAWKKAVIRIRVK